MNKKQLFKKYAINDSHAQWQPDIDNWCAVEIFRETHGGNLPSVNDITTKYILDFLEKTKDPDYFFKLKNPGSMYLTAKRMMYRYHKEILEELN